MANVDRSMWRWQTMILQPAPIDAALVQHAADESRPNGLPALDLPSYEQWEDGRCAQTLHVGPEAPTIARLHEAIAKAGLRPRGRHHEIYLGDPRRSAPRGSAP